MGEIKEVLAERGKRYGEFEHQAEYAQDIKRVFQRSPNWAAMKDDQREALELIANKIGRILNGDPNYDDSWVDIAGYAKLIADRLQKEAKRAEIDKEAARQAEIDRFNKTAEEYLQESIRQGGRLVTGPYPPYPSVAGVVGGQVLGVHSERTARQVDPLAPEILRDGGSKA